MRTCKCLIVMMEQTVQRVQDNSVLKVKNGRAQMVDLAVPLPGRSWKGFHVPASLFSVYTSGRERWVTLAPVVLRKS